MSTVDRHRLSVLGIVAIALLVALVARLASLQLAGEDDALAQAETNRTRVVHEPAPRGQILDAQGRVIVGNREARQVAIDLAALDEATDADEEARAEILNELAGVLTASGQPMTADEIETALEENLVDPLQPVPVVDEIDEELAVQLLERHRDFPGIEVDRVTVREYPYGVLAAHVLGYVGPVTQEDLVRLEDEGKTYHANDAIGRTGVELAYEDALRGEPGQRVYEVDANGDVVREIVEESHSPTPGYDVQLTLDIDLQYASEVALARQIEGVSANNEGTAVVLDPEDGSVLAMASYPTYDPLEFLNGISTRRFAQLTGPGSGFPLNNKAIQGNYSPGSTFKPFSAIVGLRNQIVSPADTFNDDGVYEVQNCEGESCEFQNAGAEEHGPVNLATSITVSSDWYYYRIGDYSWLRRAELGDSPIQDTAREFGFDQLSGIDLPFENGGILFDPERRAQVYEENPDLYLTGEWRTGDSVNMSIGQGDMQVTPVQLTNAYAALLTDGRLHRPHLGYRVLEPRPNQSTILHEEIEPELIREIDIPAPWRSAIMEGLMGVTQTGLGGTAGPAFEDFPFSSFPVGGKTGTVERQGEPDSALYVGFGPVRPGEVPDFVMSVIIPRAGVFGGDAAAPVVREVFEQLAAPEGLPPAPIVISDPAVAP